MAERVPITAETLGALEVLKGLSFEQRSAVAERCKGFRYAKEEPVFHRQDPSTDVLFIVSGRVSITLYSRSGRKTDLRAMSQGEMFGEIAAIDGKPRSADVVADEESLIVSVTAQVFNDLLGSHPAVAYGTLRHLTELVRSLSARVFEYDRFPVPARVRLELYRQAQPNRREDGTAPIVPAPKHADLAARVGTHREAVSRELSKLAKENIARRDGRALVVLDMRALLRDLDEDAT